MPGRGSTSYRHSLAEYCVSRSTGISITRRPLPIGSGHKSWDHILEHTIASVEGEPTYHGGVDRTVVTYPIEIENCTLEQLSGEPQT